MLKLLRRIRWYLGRRRYEAELNDELLFHESLARADAEAKGLAPDVAAYVTRRRIGNDAQLREESRAVWSFRWLEGLSRDLRYAFRALRHRPGFAVASMLTLMLGIGATTALWSILDPVLLRPLPYDAANDLVALREVKASKPDGQSIISPANAMFWRERGHALEDVAVYSWASVTLADEPAEQLDGRSISTNLLRVLRAAPMLGRGFAAEDTVPNAPVAILLSHALWMRRFHGDVSIVGKPIRAREAPAVVIGVMPPEFRALGGEEYWEPFPITERIRTPRGRYAMALGRLAPGQTLAAANAELRRISKGLEQEFPRFDTGWTVRALPLAEEVTGNARPVLWLLGGAIGFVLLVACANVANLHLGQAIARRGELALRAALGASRGQVLRQWLVEGLLLAFLGGAIGVALAAALVRVLVASQIAQIPRLEEVGLDLRVLGFAALVTTLAGLGFGLAPALVVREARLRGVLTGHGGADPNPGAGKVRAALVVTQVALCFMLLVGAGLVIRSLRQVLQQDPGLDPAGVISFEVSLPRRDYPKVEQRLAFFQELSRRAGALPGVKQVGLATFLPLRRIQPSTAFTIVGEPPPGPGQEPITQVNEVEGSYFAALGIPFLSGRSFGTEDQAGDNPRVLIVNQTLAKFLGGTSAALGRQLKVSWAEPDSAYTIVGVVGDVRIERLDAAARPAVFFDALRGRAEVLTLVVRASGDPGSLAPAFRRIVVALDRGLPVLDLQTMTERMHDSVADRRYPMALLSLLGAIALALAAVGLYGVLAYSVTQRHRELGVRRAIGASDAAVLRLVIGGGFRFIAAGLGLGLAGALVTTRFLGGLLFEISPTDPFTLAATLVLVAAVALTACWLPARRAMRIDPVIALRSEG
jgi:putative ABC transport system permease protein